MIDKLNFKIANEIYSKITDGTHDSPKQKETGKPLITSKHIKGRTIDFTTAYLISEEDFNKINERSQVHKWDVIVSMIGEYCGYCYIERNDIIDYAVKNVGLYKAGTKLEAEWLYYYLISPIGKAYLNSVKSGSSQPYLTLGGLRNLPILYPLQNNKKEKIAKVLSDLDAKIEVNNKINQELEAMAKTLYDYWFVQFDFPDANGKPYKSSGGKMVFNEVLKREIPEGWDIKKLDKLAEIKRGKLVTAKTADLNGQYKVVSAGIDYSYKHSEYNREKYTITVSGSGANAGFINFWRERIFANDCTTVRGKTDEETFVILQFLKLRQEYILNQARGSAQPHVYPKDLESLKILIPNIDLFKKYGKTILPFNEQIAINEKENQKLSKLRDWLLPMLMNGQVTVGKTELELGMVAEDNTKYDNAKYGEK